MRFSKLVTSACTAIKLPPCRHVLLGKRCCYCCGNLLVVYDITCAGAAASYSVNHCDGSASISVQTLLQCLYALALLQLLLLLHSGLASCGHIQCRSCNHMRRIAVSVLKMDVYPAPVTFIHPSCYQREVQSFHPMLGWAPNSGYGPR